MVAAIGSMTGGSSQYADPPRVYDLREVSPRTISQPTLEDPLHAQTSSSQVGQSHDAGSDVRKPSAGSTPWQRQEASLADPLPVPPSPGPAEMIESLSRYSGGASPSTPPRTSSQMRLQTSGGAGGSASSPSRGSPSHRPKGIPSPSRIPVPLIYSPQKGSARLRSPGQDSPAAGPSRIPASPHRSTSAQSTKSGGSLHVGQGSPSRSPAGLAVSQPMPRSVSQPNTSGRPAAPGEPYSTFSLPDRNKPLPLRTDIDIDIAVSAPTPVKARKLSYGSNESPAPGPDTRRQGLVFPTSTPPIRALPPSPPAESSPSLPDTAPRQRPTSYHPPDSPRQSVHSDRRRSSQLSPKARPRGPRPGSHHARASISSIGSIASVSSMGTGPSELRSSDYEVEYGGKRRSDRGLSVNDPPEPIAKEERRSASNSMAADGSARLSAGTNAVTLGEAIPASSGAAVSSMTIRPPRPPMNTHARRQSRGAALDMDDFGPSPLPDDEQRYMSLPVPGSRAARAPRRPQGAVQAGGLDDLYWQRVRNAAGEGSSSRDARLEHVSPRDTVVLDSTPPASHMPTVPRPDRRSPGLALHLDSPSMASKASLALGTDRPSPPVPAKSPLRRLSKPAHGRNGSVDSLSALGGSAFTSASASDTESLYIPTTEEALLRGGPSIEADPISTRPKGVPFPRAEQRYTQQSLASIYSTDSAPPSARTAYFGSGGGAGDMILEDGDSPRTMAVRMFGDIQSQYATALEDERIGDATVQKRRSRKESFGWARKRGESWASRTSVPDVPAALPRDEGVEDRTVPAKRTDLDPLSIPAGVLGQTLVDTPSSAVTQKADSFTTSIISTDAVNGHTPSVRSPKTSSSSTHATPIKSPSMPVASLGHGTPPASAARLPQAAGVTTPMQKPRSGTEPSGLIPAPFIRSPTSSTFPSAGASGASTPSGLSKRAHLIREIATTERSYANDLALVRDAFLGGGTAAGGFSRPRPTSSHSAADVGAAAAASPGAVSNVSANRNSFFSSADPRRLSIQSIASLKGPWSASSQTLPKSPSESIALGNSSELASPGSYFTSQGGGSGPASSPSLQNLSTPQPSPRSSSLAASQQQQQQQQLQLQRMKSTPGAKPLSAIDFKNVFLNIEQLASAADELAGEFEKAVGEEDANAGPGAREGDAGTDRMGEVFTSLLPKLSPLYMFYCSRQSTASVRLMELQSDPAHAAFLNDCWSRIKPHTHAWNLDSMLIKPVQRITKYPLLFDDLLACTTPVHPDYFRIRTAAEMAKGLAREIDDAKRRKDVVAGVIKKIPSGASPAGGKTDASGSGGKARKGLKLFGVSKKNASNATLASIASSAPGSRVASASSTMGMSSTTTLVDSAPPPDILPASLAYYRDLSGKLDAADICVKKTGKEIVLWTAAAKEVFVAQEGLIRTWMRIVRLEETDPPDKRLIAFRKNLADAIDDAWGPLNAEVREQILPSLARLVQAVANPRKVIARRDAKAADYARYQALKEAGRPSEKATQDSARDFAALHTQLVEELPVFLAGLNRAFDLAIVDFARVQAAYHRAVLRNLQRFAGVWIPGSLPPAPAGDKQAAANVVSLDDDESIASKPDLSTYSGIVQAWKESWVPYAQSIGDLHSTRSQKHLADRMATFQSRTGTLSHSASRASSREHSRQSSPTHSPRSPVVGAVPSPAATLSSRTRPQLHHSRSSASQRDLRDGSGRDSPSGNQQQQPRPRSTSLINGPDGSRPPRLMLPPSSPLRMSANASPAEEYDESGTLRAHRSHRTSPSMGSLDALGLGGSDTVRSSKQRPTSSSRRSQGQDASPSLSSSATSPQVDEFGMRVSSASAHDATIVGAGRQRSTYKPESPRAAAGKLRLSQHSQASSPNMAGSPDMATGTGRNKSGNGAKRETMMTTASSSARSSRSGTSEYEAAEGWRGEEVLYQCGAVADFDPKAFGDRRYRKLRFLPIRTGDLFDVFYEVGRISDLPAFPYADLVYERDGLLVGQAENGDIGLLICSFLEPLT